MAMVPRPRVDTEYPVHPADRATDRATGDSTKWTGGGIAFRLSCWLKGKNERRLRETIYAFIYRAAQKAEQLWRYLTRRQTPPSAPIEAIARYDQGSRLQPHTEKMPRLHAIPGDP